MTTAAEWLVIDSDPRITVGATGSFLDAEPSGGDAQ